MQLYLALSCLQGRPDRVAFADLAKLDGVDGIQLTPGNVPTVDFLDWVAVQGLPTRTHHGYTDRAYRQQVWKEMQLTGQWDSIHPPNAHIDQWQDNLHTDQIVEVLYPKPNPEIHQGLQCEEEIDIACAANMPLAIDVSHIYIQLEQGTLSAEGWQKLQDYDNIQEIHVSANNGKADQHRPIKADSFGIAWAKEKAVDQNLPLIIEGYFHKLSDAERQRQIDFLRC